MVCVVAAAVYRTRLPRLRVEARELIVAQGLAGGDPPQEITGPAEEVPLHATRS
jgi:hypothetical protein